MGTQVISHFHPKHEEMWTILVLMRHPNREGQAREGKGEKEGRRSKAKNGGYKGENRKRGTKEGKEDIKDMSQGLHQHP